MADGFGCLIPSIFFLGGGGVGDGSFRVVCPTDLEVDLEKLDLFTIHSPRIKSLSLQERNMQL